MDTCVKTKISVGRHINGITLNDYEWLLDDNGDIMYFDTEENAKQYLLDHGAIEDDLYWYRFEEEAVV